MVKHGLVAALVLNETAFAVIMLNMQRRFLTTADRRF